MAVLGVLPHPRESHVAHALFEGLREIRLDPVERHALALVNGQRPAELQRDLRPLHQDPDPLHALSGLCQGERERQRGRFLTHRQPGRFLTHHIAQSPLLAVSRRLGAVFVLQDSFGQAMVPISTLWTLSRSKRRRKWRKGSPIVP